MKVLLINGSNKENGCTNRALKEATKVFDSENIQYEIVQIGNDPIKDCAGCGVCRRLKNRCICDDIVNDILAKAEECDAFIFGSPVYFAHPSGRILSLLDRLFYAGGNVFRFKPGMSIVSARRAGTTASIDVFSKYFTIREMPVVSSSYWTMVHGNSPSEVEEDLEGLQTIRNGARNLVWIMKCLEAGKKAGINPPVNEKSFKTNFIRSDKNV